MRAFYRTITSNQYFFVGLAVFTTVFLVNLPFLFIDLLWHDDGSWYLFASQGHELYKAKELTEVQAFVNYRRWFYSYSMVHMGLPFTRGIHLALMALSSVLLFRLYTKVFGINLLVSLLASIIPNILPSLRGIPVGVDTTYAVWGLTPVLGSMLLLSLAFKATGNKKWIIYILSLTLYYIGINMSHSDLFLVPTVLFFIVFNFRINFVRTLIFGLPFLLLGLDRFISQLHYGHRSPEVIPFDLVVERYRVFFEMSSFLPYNSIYSVYITLSLVVFGVIGLLILKDEVIKAPEHFKIKAVWFHYMIIFWAVLWIFSNSIPYTATSAIFAPARHAYLFNFGSVFLQVFGLSFLLNRLFSFKTIRPYYKTTKLWSLIVVLLFVAYQRLDNSSYNTKLSELLRSSLAETEIPSEAQLLVLDPKNVYNPHTGNYRVNTALMRYILKRNDVYALIGNDEYPNNVFATYSHFWDRMLGFDSSKPILAFRYSNNKLQPISYLLQVYSTETDSTSTLNWSLFDLNKHYPELLGNGEGITSYHLFLKSSLSQLSSFDIAFAPKYKADELLHNSEALVFINKEGMINNKPIIYDFFTVNNIVKKELNDSILFQILLHVDSLPPGRFKLSYVINNDQNLISMWDFANVGDHILVNTKLFPKDSLCFNVNLRFMNSGVFPHAPLHFSSDEKTISNELNLTTFN